MLAQLKSKFIKGENTDLVAPEEDTTSNHIVTVSPVVDEDAVKKRIANKLRAYRPLEREANFTGPRYYR